jgi:hypothetical protein
MSDFANPYQSPQNASVPETLLSSGPVFTNTMLRYLKEASPWLRFIGILGFIGCGITIISGITAMIFGSLYAGLLSALSSLSEELVWFDSIPPILFGLVYLIYGVLLFLPALFTYRFGSQIRNYFSGNSNTALELAFKNNKAFWKFKGILAIIGLAFIPLAIIFFIIAVIVLMQ